MRLKGDVNEYIDLFPKELQGSEKEEFRMGDFNSTNIASDVSVLSGNSVTSGIDTFSLTSTGKRGATSGPKSSSGKRGFMQSLKPLLLTKVKNQDLLESTLRDYIDLPRKYFVPRCIGSKSIYITF